MFLSVFEVFKIGIGPSSSHTMGPMVAAGRFLDEIRHGDWPRPAGVAVAALRCTLFGSLAHTGEGHATDRAVILGLSGHTPGSIDPDLIEPTIAEVEARGQVKPPGHPAYRFRPKLDLVFDRVNRLPGHTNAMRLEAFDASGGLLRREYYSIGGGFVLSGAELQQGSKAQRVDDVPYPFSSAAQMLQMAKDSGRTIAQMKRANEEAMRSRAEVDAGLAGLWQAMDGCIERGLRGEGLLPGRLQVPRRARAIHQKLAVEREANMAGPLASNDWLSVYAMAVNEENAAGGRVVTAPTNGAAGVIPAVLKFQREFMANSSHASMDEMLLTAAAIGGIIKHNASISGAEVGCQGEVGSASAMAAAALCAAMGGTPAQIENAAEIALEHHLGMTCDPVGGLVQVPCIERNAFGAVKAVTAASLAMKGDGQHKVPLDTCVETMRQTGADMSERYKETSLGGLAVNVPEC